LKSLPKSSSQSHPSTAPAPKDRKTILDRRRHLKMAESAHAYVRGNTVRFYDWLLSDAVKGTLPEGPAIWICGDCHTGNLGPVADIDGNIEIQIRDLDQTVIGNPAHDLLRLGLSLAMAARSSDLPGVTTALMIEVLMEGYLEALTGRNPKTALSKVDPIRKVMRQSQARTWRHLAEERIEDVTPTIPLGRRFWPLTADERKHLKRLFDKESCDQIARCIQGPQPEDGKQRVPKIELLDAAYWMKGCSSLGRLRFAALIGVGKKNKEYRLLDIKEATHAAAPCANSSDMPANNAERVVTGARNLSPYLGDRMLATTLAGKQVVIRDLRPEDLKFDLAHLTQNEAIAIARLMAGVLGRAHARQMKRPERTAWSRDLKSRHSKGLDAPRWLWTGVLDLAALHEAAYLEHCRRFALTQIG
jgi:uncharacterized protein (DUF2252 family)